MKRFKSQHYMLVGIILIGFTILAITESSGSKDSKQPATAKAAETPEPSMQDIQTLTSKQAQYCYRIHRHLPEPQLTEQIEVCEAETADWTLEQFEEAMPQ